jgi:hypothetical protein
MVGTEWTVTLSVIPTTRPTSSENGLQRRNLFRAFAFI